MRLSVANTVAVVVMGLAFTIAVASGCQKETKAPTQAPAAATGGSPGPGGAGGAAGAAGAGGAAEGGAKDPKASGW